MNDQKRAEKKTQGDSDIEILARKMYTKRTIRIPKRNKRASKRHRACIVFVVVQC
jgi:hypothetical protein